MGLAPAETIHCRRRGWNRRSPHCPRLISGWSPPTAQRRSREGGLERIRRGLARRPDARSLEIGAVLRSWETRFGARLLQIGSDAILRVLVDGPRDVEHARQVAAEHLAFADECNQRSGYTVAELGAVLVDAPIWSLLVGLTVRAALRAEAEGLAAAVASEPPAAFARPSPCPPWTVGDLLYHVRAGVARLSHMLAEPNQPRTPRAS